MRLLSSMVELRLANRECALDLLHPLLILLLLIYELRDATRDLMHLRSSLLCHPQLILVVFRPIDA